MYDVFRSFVRRQPISPLDYLKFTIYVYGVIETINCLKNLLDLCSETTFDEGIFMSGHPKSSSDDVFGSRGRKSIELTTERLLQNRDVSRTHMYQN